MLLCHSVNDIGCMWKYVGVPFGDVNTFPLNDRTQIIMMLLVNTRRYGLIHVSA